MRKHPALYDGLHAQERQTRRGLTRPTSAPSLVHAHRRAPLRVASGLDPASESAARFKLIAAAPAEQRRPAPRLGAAPEAAAAASPAAAPQATPPPAAAPAAAAPPSLHIPAHRPAPALQQARSEATLFAASAKLRTAKVATWTSLCGPTWQPAADLHRRTGAVTPRSAARLAARQAEQAAAEERARTQLRKQRERTKKQLTALEEQASRALHSSWA